MLATMVLPNIKFTRPLTIANVVTPGALASFFFSILYYALSPSPLLPFDTLSPSNPEPNKPNGTPREAYVTFLSNEDPYYFASARLFVFALQHDPLTTDPSRPVIVLTTPSVPASYSRKFEAEGAIVIEKPLITSLPMMQTNPRLKDVYTKLWIFNLTSYDDWSTMTQIILFFGQSTLSGKPRTAGRRAVWLLWEAVMEAMSRIQITFWQDSSMPFPRRKSWRDY